MGIMHEGPHLGVQRAVPRSLVIVEAARCPILGVVGLISSMSASDGTANLTFVSTDSTLCANSLSPLPLSH